MTRSAQLEDELSDGEKYSTRECISFIDTECNNNKSPSLDTYSKPGDFQKRKETEKMLNEKKTQ